MRGHLQHRWAAVATLAAALLALAAAAAPASALSARFTINNGDEYTRGPKVVAGDGGYSPFFRPGVVVWDGGSIIAGHRAATGYEFPVQTLALVPRPCSSFVSSTASAKIADMLADAPLEVDALRRETADLNVSVVLAGGGDFRSGATAAYVYDSLRTYCLARRAAGFRVVVLTVLPAARPATFEASRLAFNAMLRDRWKTFADGLADIAGDPRIGDTGDEYDAQFYLDDQVHLTNAGNAVMAAVTAPVLDRQPWLSAGCELRVRDSLGEWGEWRPYTAATNVWLGEYEGVHAVQAEYRLDGETVAASDTIFLDTVRPQPVALRNVAVRRGKQAVLRYRIDDAEPCGPTATAVVTLKSTGGRVLKTFVRRLVPIGEDTSARFTCTLPKGTYRWVVRARDAAGNPDLAPSSALLRVR